MHFLSPSKVMVCLLYLTVRQRIWRKMTGCWLSTGSRLMPGIFLTCSISANKIGPAATGEIMPWPEMFGCDSDTKMQPGISKTVLLLIFSVVAGFHQKSISVNKQQGKKLSLEYIKKCFRFSQCSTTATEKIGSCYMLQFGCVLVALVHLYNVVRIK